MESKSLVALPERSARDGGVWRPDAARKLASAVRFSNWQLSRSGSLAIDHRTESGQLLTVGKSTQATPGSLICRALQFLQRALHALRSFVTCSLNLQVE